MFVVVLADCFSLCPADGHLSKIIETITLQPYVDATSELVLEVRIHLSANIPFEVVEAVLRNPQEALRVMVESKKRLDNQDKLSEPGEQIRGPELIHKLLPTTEYLTYEILVRKLMKGDTYLIRIDINENPPDHPGHFVKFRLVGHFFSSVRSQFEEYQKYEARLDTLKFRQCS